MKKMEFMMIIIRDMDEDIMMIIENPLELMTEDIMKHLIMITLTTKIWTQTLLSSNIPKILPVNMSWNSHQYDIANTIEYVLIL